MIRLLSGDCRDVLATLPAESVQCVVTSPPYYGLRDYGTALWDGGDAGCDHKPRPRTTTEQLHDTDTHGFRGGDHGTLGAPFRDTCGKCGAVRVDRQIGLEATPEEYLATMVGVFREVRRVLRRDGTCWVNMGDSYSTGGADKNFRNRPNANRDGTADTKAPRCMLNGADGAKPKDLLLMPARLALALQADGWWVRSAIVWAKPNPMPESVSDRPTSAYEMVYLLTRSARYFYDADAVREANTNPALPECVTDRRERSGNGEWPSGTGGRMGSVQNGRNLRNVWTIATHSFAAAHFATFPPELAERCIKAGTRPGDTVLDPFIGAGTTALVADRLQRDCIGIDLNTSYTSMAMERCRADAPLFTSFPPAEDPEESRMADLFAEAAE